MKSYWALAAAVIIPVCSAAPQQPSINGTYIATAYDQKGVTKSGDYVHRHVIAADPDIIPLGSRIKVRGAGKYSGEYVVADTGQKIQGRRLDIFVPSERECIKFGKHRVRVRLIKLGDGTLQTTKASNQEVKQDVKKDLAKNVVGNAAMEDDWAVKRTAEKQGAAPAEANEKAASAAAPDSPAKPSPITEKAVPKTDPQ